MFLDFLRAGLAEREKRKINWDPVDMTVLANEQVIDGRGWRSGAVVEQREMNQWVFKITKYSQELLDALDTLDRWPDKVRLMQRNWIGRSRRPADPLRARSGDDARRRDRAEDFHDAARHAVRRKVHGDRAGSSAGAGGGREKSEARRVHRRMQAASAPRRRSSTPPRSRVSTPASGPSIRSIRTGSCRSMSRISC